jgi:hypothetical protein
VYPRIVIVGKDIVQPEGSIADPEWPMVCLRLMMAPCDGRPLKAYNRLALFDLTKNQFASERDLDMMAMYYTLAMFKIKEINIAAETRAVIHRLVQSGEN